MITKDRELTPSLICDFCLQRRLKKNHVRYPIVKSSLERQIFGHKGEEKLDYYLDFLPEDQFSIFHGLRLESGSYASQIDTLLGSLFFFAVTEVKTIGEGILSFDEVSNQCFLLKNGYKKGIIHPFLQVKRQVTKLRRLLGPQAKNLPIIPLVSVTSPSTLIETNAINPTKFAQSVFHAEFLPERIEGLMKQFNQKVLTRGQLNSISDHLIRSHVPYFPNVLEKYNIDKADLIKGVLCPLCSGQMTRISASWHCSNCHLISKDAHLLSLIDYLLLISPTITNRDCREFLDVESTKIISTILNQTKLIERSPNNSKQYSLNSNWKELVNLNGLILRNTWDKSIFRYKTIFRKME